MIRCIPVDGSAPFEIPCDVLMVLPVPDLITAAEFAVHGGRGIVPHETALCACYVESWRERAERLERDLEIVRLARDWSEAQHSFEHGDPDAMTDIGTIEAELKALGVTREEAMQL